MAVMIKQAEMNELLRKARLELESQIQMQTIIAELRWHSYQEHIKAGFTEAQALELCKKYGFT